MRSYISMWIHLIQANKELTDDAVGALSTEEILKMTVDGNIASMSNDDLEYIGSSLVCRNGTDMKLYFINKNSLALDEILQKYNIDVTNEKTGRLDSKMNFQLSLMESCFASE